MQYNLKTIRLDKLNIPAETLRQDSTDSEDEKLEESLKQYGVIVPLLVSELGRGEYDVWEGTRRVRGLRRIGKPGSTTVPARVLDGGDRESVCIQMHANQVRERLSGRAEMEALRQLVDDHGMNFSEAAKALLKTRSWASTIMKIWKLPEKILNSLRNGDIALSHARILARYLDKPEILELLFKTSLKGSISHPRLAALGVRAENQGVKEAQKLVPRRLDISPKSWMRIEPLRRGRRVEIHLDESDDPKKAVQKLLEFLQAI